MFYVYAHVKKSGEIFYLGKGKGRRAWSKKDRNDEWHKIVLEHGISPVILADGLSEESAYFEEQELIRHFKKFGKLCNQTDGGNGSRGLSHNAAFKEKRSQYMQTDRNPMKREDVRKKISDLLKGDRHHMKRPENRVKVAGNRNGMYGHSGELNPASIKVCIDGVNYPSIRIAAQTLGIKYMTLYSRLRRNK